MHKSEKKTKDGRTVTNNWMLDQVIDTCDKHGAHNDDLIKELAIQKIEYGRICAYQPILYGAEPTEKQLEELKRLDEHLCKHIIDLGGTPNEPPKYIKNGEQ